jgi:hypothetical protein
LEYFIKDTQVNYITIIKMAASSPSGVSICVSLPMLTGILIVIDCSKMPGFNERERERERDRERVYYSIETYICSIPILEC